MGLRDTAEQLDACREQSKLDEARIAQLEQDLAEADAEVVRLTSALGDRLRHDAHGVAAAEADLTSARTRLAAIARIVDPRRDEEQLTAGAIRRILDEVTAEPWGAYLDLDEARLAERALRHSAATIRTVQELDGLDPAVAGYLPRLDALADRLGA